MISTTSQSNNVALSLHPGPPFSLAIQLTGTNRLQTAGQYDDEYNALRLGKLFYISVSSRKGKGTMAS